MDLPDEINIEIFSKLPESDWRNFALINKQNYKNYIDNKQYLIKQINTNEEFIDACLNGDIESIKQAVLVHNNCFLFKKGHKYWNKGLYYGCRAGDKFIVDFMINMGADKWNWGLEGACFKGHKHLVDYMINKGANDWSRGIAGACLGNHKDLVDYMIRIQSLPNKKSLV
jgi:hypothetical protein